MKIFLVFFSFACLLSAQVDTVKTFYPDGTPQSAIILSNGLREGECIFYYPSGKIKETIVYQAGRVEGPVNRYYENGQLKEFFNIENGKLEGPRTVFDSTGKVLSDLYYSEGVRQKEEANIFAEAEQKSEEVKELPTVKEGKTIPPVRQIDTPKKNIPGTVPRGGIIAEDDPAFFLTADIAPEPIGGIYAIQNKLVYPSVAKENGVRGSVQVRVYIDRWGETYFAEVIKGLGSGCDEAAEIAVFYARYLPAKINDKPVNSQLVLTVEFGNRSAQ